MIVRGFLKKEIIQMLRNPIMVFALLFMPLVQVLLLSHAITNEPKNMRIAIDSKPTDYAMTQIYEHAIASGWFVRTSGYGRDAFDLVRSGKADVVLVAPPGSLSKQFARGDANLQVLIDSTNVLRAQTVSGYIQALTFNFIKENAAKVNLRLPSKSLVNFKTRILFNPHMDTKMFILPAIMSIVVASSILSLICISIAREKEDGTIETLISAPIKKIHLILGKTLPFILIAFINLVSVMVISILIFKLPFRGSIFHFLISFFTFAFAMVSIGIFLSTYCKTQQQALLCVMMFLFTAMMLSGVMFPIETMPSILQFFANINPISHYVFLMRNIILKGGSLKYLLDHNIPMLIFGMITFLFGTKKLKQTL